MRKCCCSIWPEPGFVREGGSAEAPPLARVFALFLLPGASFLARFEEIAFLGRAAGRDARGLCRLFRVDFLSLAHYLALSSEDKRLVSSDYFWIRLAKCTPMETTGFTSRVSREAI